MFRCFLLSVSHGLVCRITIPRLCQPVKWLYPVCVTWFTLSTDHILSVSHVYSVHWPYPLCVTCILCQLTISYVCVTWFTLSTDHVLFIFQRAVLLYVPETVGWPTICMILSIAAISIMSALFFSRKWHVPVSVPGPYCRPSSHRADIGRLPLAGAVTRGIAETMTTPKRRIVTLQWLWRPEALGRSSQMRIITSQQEISAEIWNLLTHSRTPPGGSIRQWRLWIGGRLDGGRVYDAHVRGS